MAGWFWYAIAAAVLYGLHQVFTKLAANGISGSLGGFVVETTAAMTIATYVVFLWLTNSWTMKVTTSGIWYSVLTGICVGAGTIMFFLLFQNGGPLSAVPAVLAGGAALMAVCGILFFNEAASWPRLLGIALSIASILLLSYSPGK
jgi:bacterial/archaeal transporter family protein